MGQEDAVIGTKIVTEDELWMITLRVANGNGDGDRVCPHNIPHPLKVMEDTPNNKGVTVLPVCSRCIASEIVRRAK